MENVVTQSQIDEVNRKLDLILEETILQRMHRQELAALVAPMKKLLRNVDTMNSIIEQLESFKDFLDDASPLARESFITLMHRLDEFDRKGYFAFFKELGKVADTIVTSFSDEDVKQFGENVVTILNTVKTVTQPHMLHAVNNAMMVYDKLDMEVKEDVSLLALLKELNTPEARKAMAFTIRFLKSLASRNGVELPHV